jgi:superfamily II DNA or RNA helicase
MKPIKVEKIKSAIVLGTTKTISTGISIKNLHSAVLMTSQKSFYTTNQFIGRLMRLNENKLEAELYDLVDDLSTKSYQNYMLKHFDQRLQYYRDEGFSIKEKEINLK